MKKAKILEIKDLQKYEAHLSQKAMVWLQIAKAIKSSVNIFVSSFSPKDWPYSPFSNANSGLKERQNGRYFSEGDVCRSG